MTTRTPRPATCPKCDTERTTTAQPRARLLCGECGEIFAAPPLVPAPPADADEPVAGGNNRGAGADDPPTPAAGADHEPTPGVEVVVVDGVDIDPVEVIPPAATPPTATTPPTTDDPPPSPPTADDPPPPPPPTEQRRLNPRGRRRAARS